MTAPKTSIRAEPSGKVASDQCERGKCWDVADSSGFLSARCYFGTEQSICVGAVCVEGFSRRAHTVSNCHQAQLRQTRDKVGPLGRQSLFWVAHLRTATRCRSAKTYGVEAEKRDRVSRNCDGLETR